MAAAHAVTSVAGQAVDPVEVISMRAVLGAEVRCGDVRALSDSAFDVIHAAALNHLVILIRGQTLTDPASGHAPGAMCGGEANQITGRQIRTCACNTVAMK